MITWLDVNTQHREHREKHVMWMSSMSSVQLWSKATRKVRHSTLLQHCQSSAWPFRLESGAGLEPSTKPRQSWRANPWNGRQLAGDSTRIESIVQTCSDGSFQENGKKCRKRRSNEVTKGKNWRWTPAMMGIEIFQHSRSGALEPHSLASQMDLSIGCKSAQRETSKFMRGIHWRCSFLRQVSFSFFF